MKPKRVNKYGQAAEIAVRLLISHTETDPRRAWNLAVGKVFPESASGRAKACPRNSFLALCECGAVNHVQAGTYTRSTKNKQYVQRALEALRCEPSLLQDEERLWRIASKSREITANSQVAVLIALWQAGLIEHAL